MKKKVLLLFVKNPEAGKVKTRLAKTVGNANALKIYHELVQHTQKITVAADADKRVCYSKAIVEDDVFSPSDYQKTVQAGEDLGFRMEHAFQTAFDDGYENVVIIGSDCYDLDTATIDQAFTALETNDAVIGPALDGGYYLLGLSKPLSTVFHNKVWSTDAVFPSTIGDFDAAGFSFATLPALSDVDHESDLGALRVHLNDSTTD